MGSSATIRLVPPPFVPASAVIPRRLLDEVIAWSRAGLPNEACGLLAGSRTAEEGGIASRFFGMRNAAGSPDRFSLDPEEQLRLTLGIDEAGEVVWGICHSHVASAARPSATDVALAAWPDALYLVCSLASEPPVVRAWTIREGGVSEIVLEPA